MKLKVWFMELRPQFLLLSPVLIFLGTSVALYEGFFDLLNFILALIGLLLIHISVNVLNDYFDYQSGIDLETKRTPFSGGSGILPEDLLSPRSVYRLGVACLTLAVVIGIYFIVTVGLLLTPLIFLGVILTYFYSTHFAKWMVGELCAGLGMGALPVVGAFFVQAGYYSTTVIVASIIPLILVSILLLINQFPDVDIDMKHGRRNMVIWLGKAKASRLYSILLLIMYGWIILSVTISWMPLPVLIGLLTLPFGIKAIYISIKHHSDDIIVGAMAANVIVMLLTQALIGIGFVIATLL